jgi:hypothetical protein
MEQYNPASFLSHSFPSRPGNEGLNPSRFSFPTPPYRGGMGNEGWHTLLSQLWPGREGWETSKNSILANPMKLRTTLSPAERLSPFTVLGDSDLCAWRVADSVIWVQTRLPKQAARLAQRADSRLVVRGVAGGYLRTFEFTGKTLAWAERMIGRYIGIQTLQLTRTGTGLKAMHSREASALTVAEGSTYRTSLGSVGRVGRDWRDDRLKRTVGMVGRPVACPSPAASVRWFERLNRLHQRNAAKNALSLFQIAPRPRKSRLYGGFGVRVNGGREHCSLKFKELRKCRSAARFYSWQFGNVVGRCH